MEFSNFVRNKFVDFFRSKEHKIVPSAPIVMKDDPTLMFTNAGMNQFKDVFLGVREPAAPRVADTQKCLRVSGKHNDLEEVGHDTYHHTMFEMLGNWSFGDYYKKEAIEWAWELLTKELKLEADRLYVTVFGGDETDKTTADEEAVDEWKKWVDEDRILLFGKKENFWEMGDTGPCGPCSEIHIDLRSDDERNRQPGADLVNRDHPRVIEIWNLVFMEYNRLADGSLHQLPRKHVDTGMGFERLCMAMQDKKSTYDIDLFDPLRNYLKEELGVNLAGDEKQQVAIRVVMDHIRAIAFAIADGQLPSNTGAGYVIRRVLRRASRYGFSVLNIREPFLHRLVPVLGMMYEEAFPELKSQQQFVAQVVEEEEKNFLRTLENGLRRFESFVSLNTIKQTLFKVFGENNIHSIDRSLIPNFWHELSHTHISVQIPYSHNESFEAFESFVFMGNGIQEWNSQVSKVPGSFAFELYDTFGFPLDLTQLLAKEKNLTVDVQEFERLMQQQKDRSRAATEQKAGDWVQVGGTGESSSEFVGYDQLHTNTEIVRYRTLETKKGKLFQLVLTKTPFYPEGGGQVGDMGFIEHQHESIRILDTKRENEEIVHYVDKLPADPGGEWMASVDETRRKRIMANHSATHLLHAALRQVLGVHVEQRGSLVNDKILRFDFSHFAKMTEEEIAEVEDLVNEKIDEMVPMHEHRKMPMQQAKEIGAMALFGEKYGDEVRVVILDPGFSTELCGGTHVKNSGQIRLFKIVGEASVAAGVRRIEALTGDAARKYLDEEAKQLEVLREVLKNRKDPVKAAEQLIERNKELEKQLEKMASAQAGALKSELKQKVKEVDGVRLINEVVQVHSANDLKTLAFELRKNEEKLLIVLGAIVNEKPLLNVIMTEDMKGGDLHAGKIIRELAQEIKGGGGGQDFFASAGGSDPAGLEKAVKKVEDVVRNA